MSVPVEDHIHLEAGDRIFEPAATEEREELGRLAFDRAFDRRVMEQRHPLRGVETAQGAFEAERLARTVAPATASAELGGDGIQRSSQISTPRTKEGNVSHSKIRSRPKTVD